MRDYVPYVLTAIQWLPEAPSQFVRINQPVHCSQAKPYKYTCHSCQAAVTCVLVNILFHVLGKDYFMLHIIVCGFITARSPFKAVPRVQYGEK